MKYRKGMRVTWCGVAGTVVRIDKGSSIPVIVRFDANPDRLFGFFENGAYLEFQKSSLRIARKK